MNLVVFTETGGHEESSLQEIFTSLEGKTDSIQVLAQNTKESGNVFHGYVSRNGNKLEASDLDSLGEGFEWFENELKGFNQ